MTGRNQLKNTSDSQSNFNDLLIIKGTNNICTSTPKFTRDFTISNRILDFSSNNPKTLGNGLSNAYNALKKIPSGSIGRLNT